MLKKAAGKIYGWIEPHMDNDKMLTKIKRVYICTDAAARDKCAGDVHRHYCEDPAAAFG